MQHNGKGIHLEGEELKKMEQYVIMREDRANWMLKGLAIGSDYGTPDQWTKNKKLAIKFNEEEARDTIEFITNVVSEYLGENLYTEEI